MNDKVYHLNVKKERCAEKAPQPKLADTYTDRYHGAGYNESDEKYYCFSMKNENILVRYDPYAFRVQSFNLSSD